ncbi:hypothetical protein Gpo141_00008591 [Globisporangium polare]
MLAFSDEELLSLFADDAPPPSCTVDGVEDARDISNSALRVGSPHPLSADEIDELLLGLHDEDEQKLPPQVQVQELELELEVEPVQQAPEPAPQLQPASGKAALKNKKKTGSSKLSNKARDGRKEEILYLQKTVLELETRLNVLKINKKTPATQERSNYSGDNRRGTARPLAPAAAVLNGVDQAAGLPEVWREIARHQCDERDKSERKNIRLRLALESQLKVAKSLETFLVLKAAACAMDIGKSIDLQRYGQMAHYNDFSGLDRDAAIFQNLLVGVEQMLAEVDAVYEANGLARVETTQIDAQTRFDAERESMFVEVCASKVLPFSVKETGAAVWDHYVFAKRRMPSRYYFYHSHKSIDETEDTIVEDFSVELHSKNKRGSFRMRQVTRRLVKDDRVVIVWRSYSDPLEFSEQPLSGLRSFEKGYIVIRASSSGVTLLQPCHIMYPCASVEGSAVTSDTVVGAITDFRMSATADFVASTYQMVENWPAEGRSLVVEAERIAIVWRTFFDPSEFSDQQLSRVRFFEKGYSIDPHSATDGGGLSGQSDSVVNGVTDFMLSATIANVTATHQMVETVLLEQTL